MTNVLYVLIRVATEDNDMIDCLKKWFLPSRSHWGNHHCTDMLNCVKDVYLWRHNR